MVLASNMRNARPVEDPAVTRNRRLGIDVAPKVVVVFREKEPRGRALRSSGSGRDRGSRTSRRTPVPQRFPSLLDVRRRRSASFEHAASVAVRVHVPRFDVEDLGRHSLDVDAARLVDASFRPVHVDEADRDVRRRRPRSRCRAADPLLDVEMEGGREKSTLRTRSS
ncbi:MAG: hypothetical protein U0169_26960 [Polyangiaceae bacterium]